MPAKTSPPHPEPSVSDISAAERELLLAPPPPRPWYLRYTAEVNLVGAVVLLTAVTLAGLGIGSYLGYRGAVREFLSTPGYSYDQETEPPSLEESLAEAKADPERTLSPVTSAPASRSWLPFGRPAPLPQVAKPLSKVEKQVIEKATTTFLIKFYATKTAVAEAAITATPEATVTPVTVSTDVVTTVPTLAGTMIVVPMEVQTISVP